MRIPENDAALIYYSTWEAINCIEDDSLWREAVTDIMNYMYFYDEPKSKAPIVMAILKQVHPVFQAARMRHEKAIKNGEKGKDFGVDGGRPKQFDDDEIIELRKKGMTQKIIAKHIGCSVETVKRALRKNNS